MNLSRIETSEFYDTYVEYYHTNRTYVFVNGNMEKEDKTLNNDEYIRSIIWLNTYNKKMAIEHPSENRYIIKLSGKVIADILVTKQRMFIDLIYN